MLTAEARVPTERASRYLVQLCTSTRSGRSTCLARADTQYPPVQRAEWSDTHAVITLDRGQCTLAETAHTLMLRVEAADTDSFPRVQDMQARRLKTIGRREHLTVTW